MNLKNLPLKILIVFKKWLLINDWIKSPRPVRKRENNAMGMSMTANTARRLDNMPEPVKPSSLTRRSNEDQRVSHFSRSFLWRMLLKFLAMIE